MPDTKHLQAGVQVAAGLALNVFPAIFIAIYARIAPIETQGFLALALAVGVYVAQLFNAFIVEGRLATPDADGELGLPTWVVLLSTAACGLLVFGPAVASSAILMASAIGVMTGLLMTRSIGVVTGEWKNEGAAAGALIVASLIALWMADQGSPHSVRVLAIGALLAVVVRYRPRKAMPRMGFPPDVRRSSWVTAETAVVGAVQPAITSLLLVLVGPAASVTFRVISTVAGALEPILAYGRYRLLAHGHRGELKAFVAVFAVGMAAVLIAAFGGVGSLVFGPAWQDVGVAAMLLACLWKAAMLVSTVPFAALRKAGKTVLVFWIRGASTVVYLVVSVGLLFVWQNTAAIFLAFVVAEMITAVVYHFAAVMGAPDYAATFGTRRLRQRFG
uniref:Polysaccharide biosynthesis protein n=3 Tax=unclassified Mycobacterium TaxID=2642494 RepID=A0A5Q5BMN7_MYCSS